MAPAYALEFDGACEPVNPGGTGAWGYVLRAAGDGPSLDEDAGVVSAGPAVTNNAMEYEALARGLEAVLRHLDAGHLAASDSLSVFGDSQLVIQQLTGRWRVGEGHYRPHHDHARAVLDDLLPRLASIDLQWVPREKNRHADSLCRLAMIRAGVRWPSRT